jgi:hypothetical protein
LYNNISWDGRSEKPSEAERHGFHGCVSSTRQAYVYGSGRATLMTADLVGLETMIQLFAEHFMPRPVLREVIYRRVDSAEVNSVNATKFIPISELKQV